MGLGGAGTNIVESYLNNNSTLELLESGVTRLSLMALDIADPDIKSLEESYSKILDIMKKKGIPHERLSLIAKSIKFPSAEAMFDFVHHKFEEHLLNEEIKIENYNPWLPSTMSIPPLAGGAGRRRSLAKAIYNLNFYQLGIIKSLINMYKDQALSSITTPIVLIIFGLGGGTGGGIVFDFARHIRKATGSGVPILALCILPCAGDDPPAKGYSAFHAINELSTLLNRNTNESLIKEFGEEYRNPFNAVLFLPLMPAYSKTGNIIIAREEIDQMITEMIYVLMDFDMADLLSGIGTEVGLTAASIHTISMVKVNYPVDAYVNAFKIKLEEIQKISQIREDKLDVLNQIRNILEVKHREVKNLYKRYLIETNSFNEEEFEDKVKALEYGSPRFEEDYNLYIRGIQGQFKSWIDESLQFLSTMKIVSQEGTIEDSVRKLIMQNEEENISDSLEGLIRNISKTYPDFSEKKAAIFERLQQLVPSSQLLSVRQKKLVEDFMNITELTEKTLQILRFYNEIRHLTDAMIRLYEILPQQEFRSINFKDIKTELTTIYHLLQLMIKKPQEEVKMIDEYLTYIQSIINKFRSKKDAVDNNLLRLEEKAKRREFDKTKQEKETSGLLKFGKKRYAKDKLRDIERELRVLNEEKSLLNIELDDLDKISDLYNDLLKKLEVTSEYRKKLNSAIDLSREHQKLFSEIIKPKNYYERTTELTQDEQVNIIYQILAEQEEALSRENILTEILDLDHFKDYMRSVVRVYRTPNVMGLKSSFRSDYLWVTVQSPPGLWDTDLNQELFTALAGYVTGDVSRTITIRETPSRDPWVIRIVVVGGRGRMEDLAPFDEMERLNRKASDFEKSLSRSFLLEHLPLFEDIIKKIQKK